MKTNRKVLATAVTMALVGGGINSVGVAAVDSIHSWGGWAAGRVPGSPFPQTQDLFNLALTTDDLVQNDQSEGSTSSLDGLIDVILDNADFAAGYSATQSDYWGGEGESHTGSLGQVGVFLNPGTDGDDVNVDQLHVHGSNLATNTHQADYWGGEGGPGSVFMGSYEGEQEGTRNGADYWGPTEGDVQGVVPGGEEVGFAEGYAEGAGTSEEGEFDFSETLGFVAGTPTPLADMDDLMAGNVTANYTGDTLIDGNYVDIDVDFGAASWTGDFDYGWFNASGGISGADISGAVANNGEDIVGGSVQGTFIGSMAEDLIGGYILDFGDGEGVGENAADVFHLYGGGGAVE